MHSCAEPGCPILVDCAGSIRTSGIVYCRDARDVPPRCALHADKQELEGRDAYSRTE